jgi:alkylation response protein AidB-like acyl-CoA dehydrogenase
VRQPPQAGVACVKQSACPRRCACSGPDLAQQSSLAGRDRSSRRGDCCSIASQRPLFSGGCFCSSSLRAVEGERTASRPQLRRLGTPRRSGTRSAGRRDDGPRNPPGALFNDRTSRNPVNQGHIFDNGFSEQSQRAVGLYFDTTIVPDPSGDGYRLNGKKYYSTGSLFSSYTAIFASTPRGNVAAAVIPVDREGLELKGDWDGFGQRLTGTGSTILNDVYVAEEEVEELGHPDDVQPPSYQYAFLQLYLQAVAAGILQAVRNDAVALVRRRKRNFSHARAAEPTADPQVLQVVGEIAADAFAAEAIVLAAADVIAEAARTVQDGVPDRAAAERAQIAAAQAKVSIDRFAHETAGRLFDAGGASATQSAHNLDRHWRNARTASTHNPTHAKATAVGDFYVNGKAPPINGYF